jgi:hypothetical protein
MATSDYEEWLAQVPESMKRDPLWNFQIYPKALFLSDLVWEDTDQMMKDLRGRAVAQQLADSIGSICANIEEGHGRGFGQRECLLPARCLGLGTRIPGLVLSEPSFARS